MNSQGYEPIAFQCELIKIYNGTKPNISWQVLEMEGGPILNYTESSGNRIVIQYDHIGYFQIHSPSMTLNGLQARCVATHPSSPTEEVYSEWALANMTGMQDWNISLNNINGHTNETVKSVEVKHTHIYMYIWSDVQQI